MIYNYPFFGFPNYFSQSNQYHPPMTHGQYIKKTDNSVPPKYVAKPTVNGTNGGNSKPFDSTNSSKSFKNESFKNQEKKENQQEPFFNLFGISLFFDDILLICVILFLYHEEIDDDYLLLSLVLLLLG